eukprot:1575628-Rhodomonas_salina.3
MSSLASREAQTAASGEKGPGTPRERRRAHRLPPPTTLTSTSLLQRQTEVQRRSVHSASCSRV